MKLKQFLALFLAVAATFSLAACSGGNTQEKGNKDTLISEAAQQGENLILDGDAEYAGSEYTADEMRLVSNETSATLYPWGTDLSNTALFEIYETLFAFETYGGAMKPMLADASRGEFGGYDHEKGTMDYTVYIYDYIFDHAGNHITANDVKFSYDKQVALAHPGSTPWPDYVGCDVVDDTTVTFHFAREMTGLDDLSNFWPNCFVISEKAFTDSLGGSSDENAALVTDACGTGPYKLVSYASGSDTVLEKYDEYWQKDDSLKLPMQYANVKKITLVSATESAQQVLALQKGELDYVNEVSGHYLGEFFGEGVTGYNLYSWAQSGERYLAPNCSEESICSDVNMRLAIFYAIDTEGLCTALGGDTAAKRVYGLFGCDQSDANADWANWENYQTVTDQAKVDEYLKAAGYNKETLVFIAGKKEETCAQIITNMLTEAGINVELQVLDTSSFNSANTSPASWDILMNRCSGWCGAVSASRVFLPFDSFGGKTQNYVYDEEWMGLLKEILTTEGHTAENIDKWQQMAIDNGYAMGLYSLVSNVVFKDSIESICRNGKNITIPGGCIYVDPNA